MNESHDTRTVVDFVYSALEATCDALMTLESIRDSAAAVRASAPSASEPHVAQAIASLRHAIAELRLARSRDTSPIALGFVVRSTCELPGETRRRTGQPRPRRTA